LLCLVMVPGRPVLLTVVFEDREHALDHSSAPLPPLLLGPVRLDPRILSQPRQLPERVAATSIESPLDWPVTVLVDEVLAQTEAQMVTHSGISPTSLSRTRYALGPSQRLWPNPA